jgi:hypothetical protein
LLLLDLCIFMSEQSSQMGLHGCSCLDRKARSQRIEVSIGADLRAINVELFALDQLLLLALLHNGVEEAAKDVHAISFSDARETGMVRQGLAQIVPQIPPHTEPIRCMPYQLAFRAYSFKEHDELQFEEHDGINGGTTTVCIGRLYELADKREIKCALQVTIEMIVWHAPIRLRC